MKFREYDASDGDALTVKRLEVAVPVDDALVATIRRMTVARAFWVLVGFTRSATSHDEELDELALLETREHVRARAAVRAGLGEVARELLAAHPEASLEIGGGEVRVSVELRDGCREKVAGWATRAARAVEAARIRPVLREDTKGRCGFCHGDVEPADEPVVRCDRCSASVHAGCWKDNEGCPALGCRGAAR